MGKFVPKEKLGKKARKKMAAEQRTTWAFCTGATCPSFRSGSQILISENARTAQDQNDYNQKYNALYGSYDQKLARLEAIEGEIGDKEALGERK